MTKRKPLFIVKALVLQGFYNCLKYKDKSWKYQSLTDALLDICAEDECDDIMEDPNASGIRAKTI